MKNTTNSDLDLGIANTETDGMRRAAMLRERFERQRFAREVSDMVMPELVRESRNTGAVISLSFSLGTEPGLTIAVLTVDGERTTIPCPITGEHPPGVRDFADAIVDVATRDRLGRARGNEIVRVHVTPVQAMIIRQVYDARSNVGADERVSLVGTEIKGSALAMQALAFEIETHDTTGTARVLYTSSAALAGELDDLRRRLLRGL